MSTVSWKNTLSVATLSERLKTQHHLMEVTFLVHQITLDAVECACTFACHLCTKCFNEEFQVTVILKC